MRWCRLGNVGRDVSSTVQPNSQLAGPASQGLAPSARRPMASLSPPKATDQHPARGSPGRCSPPSSSRRAHQIGFGLTGAARLELVRVVCPTGAPPDQHRLGLRGPEIAGCWSSVDRPGRKRVADVRSQCYLQRRFPRPGKQSTIWPLGGQKPREKPLWGRRNVDCFPAARRQD